MKRLLVFSLLGAGVVTAALFATPLLVSTDLVASALTKHVLGWTGQTLSFEGTPEVRFDGGLSIRFEDARIGPENSPLAEMDALVVRLEMLPLFIGRLETKSFELDRPRFTVNEGGPKLSDYALAADRTRPRFGTVTVRSGSLVYRDAAGEKTFSADAIDAEFDWPSFNEAFNGRGWLAWRGEPIEFGATVASPAELAAGRTSGVRFSVGAKPVRASFSGTMQAAANWQAEGDVNLSTASLRDLSAWLDGPGGEGATFGAASVEGRARLSPGFLSLTEATLRLDGNEAEGALTYSAGPTRPSLAGTLALDTLDLTPYIDELNQTRDLAGWRSWTVPIAALETIDLDLRASANEVLTGPIRLGRTAGAATVSAGRLAASLGEAQLFGGRLVGSFDAGPKEGGAELRLSARVDDIPARAALSQLLGLTAIDGTGSGEVALAAQGPTFGALLRSLAGSGSVQIANGAISGVEIGAIVRAVRSGSFKPLDSLIGGSSPFTRLSAGIAIKDGKAESDDFSVAGVDYSIELDGAAPLGEPAISGRGRLMIDRNRIARDTAPDTVAVPFLIGGRWSEPTVVPDFDGLLRHAGEVPRLGQHGELADLAIDPDLVEKSSFGP